MDSDDEVFLFALACEEEEKRRKEEKRKRTKKLWVHDINLSRDAEGEYNTLFPRLKCDEKRFKTYFRMSVDKFYEILHLVELHITKQYTKYRRPISAEERLVVTLR